MTLQILAFALVSLAISMGLEKYWILWMERLKIEQNLKLYGLERHLQCKGGTPTMGGIVFLITAFFMLVFYVFRVPQDFGKVLFLWSLPFLSAFIGLLDDGLKQVHRSSEGMSSLQKLGAQILISLPWVWVASLRGLYLWPGFCVPFSIGVPVLLFFVVGMMNAVNVTDGLDGLAAGSCAISFLAALLLFPFDTLGALSASIPLALVIGFLWFNANPAKVFMGDVGAHFLAGILIALCVYQHYLIAIFPLGFLFGLEICSVAIQIVSIRGFNRKVFRMSPIHHHFELLGWSEPQIVIRFWIIHLIGMVLLICALYPLV